jgi:hypothetical protein
MLRTDKSISFEQIEDHYEGAPRITAYGNTVRIVYERVLRPSKSTDVTALTIERQVVDSAGRSA